MQPVDSSRSEAFTEFVAASGPRLQQGLIAALGPDVGSDAAAEALRHGWENWERVAAMANPTGYLFVVGRNAGRRMHKKPVFPAPIPPVDDTPWIEPGLPDALASLSERQRIATTLVHGGGWSYADVADLLQVDRGTVKKHADRGLKRLRVELKVDLDA